MKTNKLYFKSKKQAESVAKRRGHGVHKMPNGMYFVGTKSDAKKRSSKLASGVMSTYSKKSYYRDKNLTAKPAGRRKSKSGKTYYEYRSNRTDTNRKTGI